MEQQIFAFLLIIEGDTEKMLQCTVQFKSVYHKNFGFTEQKMYFWKLQTGSNKEKSIN